MMTSSPAVVVGFEASSEKVAENRALDIENALSTGLNSPSSWPRGYTPSWLGDADYDSAMEEVV